MADSGNCRLYPLAQTDLEDIWSYTASRWSVEQAASYHASIVVAFDDLATGRRHGRPSDIRAGYFRFAIGSHLIFYRRAEAGIDVVRILHQRMDASQHL